MIHDFINNLNTRYNRQSRRSKVYLLLGFCLAFLLGLWLAVSYMKFDLDAYGTKQHAHIGKPSGSVFPDSTKHQKQ